MHLYIVEPYRLSVNIFLSVVGFFFGSLSVLSLFVATLINFMYSYRKHESDEHYPLLYIFFIKFGWCFSLPFFTIWAGARKIFQFDSFLFVSKSVVIQVHNYLNCKNPFAASRSVYRKHLSTETALLRVTDNIPKTLDSILICHIKFNWSYSKIASSRWIENVSELPCDLQTRLLQ